MKLFFSLIVSMLLSINVMGYMLEGVDIDYADKSDHLSIFTLTNSKSKYIDRKDDYGINYNSGYGVGVEYPLEFGGNFYFPISLEVISYNIDDQVLNINKKLNEYTISFGFSYKSRYGKNFSIDYSMLQFMNFSDKYKTNKIDIGGLDGGFYPRIKLNYKRVGLSVGYKMSQKLDYTVFAFHIYF